MTKKNTLTLTVTLNLPDVGFFWNLERGGGVGVMAPPHKIHKNDDFLLKMHMNIKHDKNFLEKSKNPE